MPVLNSIYDFNPLTTKGKYQRNNLTILAVLVLLLIGFSTTEAQNTYWHREFDLQGLLESRVHNDTVYSLGFQSSSRNLIIYRTNQNGGAIDSLNISPKLLGIDTSSTSSFEVALFNNQTMFWVDESLYIFTKFVLKNPIDSYTTGLGLIKITQFSDVSLSQPIEQHNEVLMAEVQGGALFYVARKTAANYSTNLIRVNGSKHEVLRSFDVRYVFQGPVALVANPSRLDRIYLLERSIKESDILRSAFRVLELDLNGNEQDVFDFEDTTHFITKFALEFADNKHLLFIHCTDNYLPYKNPKQPDFSGTSSNPNAALMVTRINLEKKIITEKINLGRRLLPLGGSIEYAVVDWLNIERFSASRFIVSFSQLALFEPVLLRNVAVTLDSNLNIQTNRYHNAFLDSIDLFPTFSSAFNISPFSDGSFLYSHSLEDRKPLHTGHQFEIIYKTDVNLCMTDGCETWGCTNRKAYNFGPNALIDDGSCVVPACEQGVEFTFTTPTTFTRIESNDSSVNSADLIFEVIGSNSRIKYISQPVSELCTDVLVNASGAAIFSGFHTTFCPPDTSECFYIQFVDAQGQNIRPNFWLYIQRNFMDTYGVEINYKDIKRPTTTMFSPLYFRSNSAQPTTCNPPKTYQYNFPVVYPNPSNGQLTLDWPFSEAGKWRVEVLDAAGQVLYKALDLEARQFLDLDFLRSGVYFLRFVNLEDSEQLIVRKIIRY
ncbi:MAG: hypothetical protein ACI83I_000174 [Bacteroidia bacterium]